VLPTHRSDHQDATKGKRHPNQMHMDDDLRFEKRSYASKVLRRPPIQSPLTSVPSEARHGVDVSLQPIRPPVLADWTAAVHFAHHTFHQAKRPPITRPVV